MIDLRKNKYNLILGVIIGFLLAQLVILEGYAILITKENIGVLTREENVIKILAAIVFLLTILIFNTKRFRNINFDKISIYLTLVVIISIVVTIEGIIFLSIITVRIFPDIYNYILENEFFSINLAYLVFALGVSIFLITYTLLVNRKVKYIKFLTKEVKIIKEEGFGKTIKVKGGDELSELCKSINDMSQELGKKIENEKRIENNKNELITNISHDLKTPLTSIVGYLELLNNKQVDDNLRDEYISIAYNKSLRLKSLVNELFQYTKLTSNDIKLERNRINISMLLNQAVGESIINFSEKNIDVILDNPYNEAFCNIDSVQILRVFENLINNAEKYSDPYSKFKVSLKIKDKKILISFTNKCESISEEYLDRIFERFYREDKSRNKEGTGLGLAIVKRIIDLHEGNITVEKIDNDIKFNVILKEA
ncbi:MAG: HAMP domain-containing histidine kinase [Clostridium sp.]|uniref:sensor histidine kinase n=1 Tax=Clostridium sp. TaxID=1506 RepID=UPI0025B7F005|nr:HAMP domain-containing sensor histidine kinase [Clostridium sp.]MCF0148253.1 HAMP domain-containing histidine kinase [Clostridium sp.]